MISRYNFTAVTLSAPPPRLCRAEVESWNEHLRSLNSFTPTGRRPDHIIMSRSVDVTVFPLERLVNQDRAGLSGSAP